MSPRYPAGASGYPVGVDTWVIILIVVVVLLLLALVALLAGAAVALGLIRVLYP